MVKLAGWAGCWEGRVAASSQDVPRLAEVRSLVDEFIVNNAPSQVNIGSQLQKSKD